MRINRVIIILIVGLSLLFASCSKTTYTEVPQETPKVVEEEILVEVPLTNVGVIAPLTGNSALDGQETLKVIQLAQRVFGEKINLIIEDGKCEGPKSEQAANKLVNLDDVKYILGGICSDETLAAAPIVEEGKVILISSASTSPKITNAGEYIFRTVSSDTFQGRVMAEFSKKMRWNRIFILYENTNYGQALAQVFKNSVEGMGTEVTSFESFKKDETNFGPIIEKIINSEIDALYFVPQNAKNAQTFGEQLREKNVKIQILASETFENNELAQSHGDIYDGAFVASPKVDENSQKVKEFKQLWEENYGEFKNEMGTLLYYLSAFENFKLISESIEKCGEDTQCAKENLNSIENREGYIGTYSIDKNGDVSNTKYNIKQLKENKFQIYE